MSNEIVSKIASKSTGPTTEGGKAIASKNATKTGIFSKGYLPWEDQDAKQAEWQALAKEWEVCTPTGIHFLRDIEQANLAQERLMYAERKVVEGAMQSSEVGANFVLRSGINEVVALDLPSWFFLEDDGGNKAYAIYLSQVYDQASELKKSYSDQLVANAQTRYPQLYDYVMKGYAHSNSFVMVLSKKYQKSMPTLNLVEVINEIVKNYRFHLIWAQEPVRYQHIVDGLRAEKMLEVLDFDKSNRYLTNFQNRRMRALQGLEALERRSEAKRLANVSMGLVSGSVESGAQAVKTS